MVNNIFVLRTIILLKDTTQFEKNPKQTNNSHKQTKKNKQKTPPNQTNKTNTLKNNKIMANR